MSAARAIVIGRSAGIVLLATILQVSIASSFTLLGVRPELSLLLAVAAGVATGPERGAVIGFALGLGYDLFLQSPLGLTALVYAVLAHLTGTAQGQMTGARRASRMLLVGGGSALGVVAWVLAARLLDAAGAGVLTVLRVAIVAGIVNALLAPAATRLWSWVFAVETPVRAPG